MQRCTKVPMMLNSIRQHTRDTDERQLLADALDKLEESLSQCPTPFRRTKRHIRLLVCLVVRCVCLGVHPIIIIVYYSVKGSANTQK